MKTIMTDQHYSIKIAGIVSAFFISALLWLMIICAGKLVLSIFH